MRDILKLNWVQTTYRFSKVFKGKFGKGGWNIFLNSLFSSVRIILKLESSTFFFFWNKVLQEFSDIAWHSVRPTSIWLSLIYMSWRKCLVSGWRSLPDTQNIFRHTYQLQQLFQWGIAFARSCFSYSKDCVLMTVSIKRSISRKADSRSATWYFLHLLWSLKIY